MLLKDKIALITGGTRGIGLATVKKFLDEGATVIFCGSREESVDQAVEELSDYDKSKFKGIWPDLLDYNDVEENYKKVIEEFGRIDILVNNAGISSDTPFEDYSQKLFEKVMDINVTAVYNSSKAVYEHMKENKSGVILSTSSMVSRDAQAGGIAYPTSKFAVNGFTLSLAREMAPHGVRVNAVAPGIINTDMVKALPEEMIQPLIQAIPLGRLGEGEDIANAFAFLASDDASYITGQVLYVDGLMKV